MPKFKCNGLDELNLDLAQLALIPDDTKFAMLEAGAAVLTAKWKEVLQGMKRTGQLFESIKAARKKGDTPIVSITPKGKRENAYTGQRKTKSGGTYQGTNAEVAYILEFGTPRMAATHWMETANEEASDDVLAAEYSAYDDFVNNLNL